VSHVRVSYVIKGFTYLLIIELCSLQIGRGLSDNEFLSRRPTTTWLTGSLHLSQIDNITCAVKTAYRTNMLKLLILLSNLKLLCDNLLCLRLLFSTKRLETYW